MPHIYLPSLCIDRSRLEIVPFLHLSLVPNIKAYFIFPDWTADAKYGNDRDGTEQ